MEDPWSGAEERFSGYGTAGIPDERDSEVNAVLDEVMSKNRPGMRAFRNGLGDTGRSVLTTFAERMASLSVRQQNVDVAKRALLALALAWPRGDRRESLMSLAVVDDALRRLLGSSDEVLADVAAAVGGGASNAVASWISRSEKARSIDAMGFSAVEAADGFRYQWLSR